MRVLRRKTEAVLNRLGPMPFIILGLTLIAPALFGSPLPTCVMASLSTYDAAGYECTLGDFTLEDFTFSATGTGGAELDSDSQINVNPTGSTPTSISMQFSTPGGFTVSSGQTAQYVVQYVIDPMLPSITAATIDLGPNDPVTLTGEFCGNGIITSAPDTTPGVLPYCTGNASLGIYPAQLQLTGTGPAAYSDPHLFPPSVVTTLDTELILDLDGPAEADYFGSTTSVTSGGPAAVPEPSSALWLAPGLLALVWLRKKRQASVLRSQ
jgi:hypothetical protein